MLPYLSAPPRERDGMPYRPRFVARCQQWVKQCFTSAMLEKFFFLSLTLFSLSSTTRNPCSSTLVLRWQGNARDCFNGMVGSVGVIAVLIVGGWNRETLGTRPKHIPENPWAPLGFPKGCANISQI